MLTLRKIYYADTQILKRVHAYTATCIYFNRDRFVFTITGSSPPGEFFSPGYDCASILDKDPKAKDGFYWITIGEKKPRKVFI